MKNMISIVIIEYHSLIDVENCILSFKNQRRELNLEFIVSSNSLYNIEKQLELQQKYNDVIWAFNLENGGFAYAMNCGAKLAHSSIILCVNSDTRMVRGLKEMYDYAVKHDCVGIIAPKIVNENGILQDSCREYLSISSFVMRHCKRIFKNKSVILSKNIDYNSVQSVDWVIGAFMMIKKDVFDMVNGFDDNYFLYCEDADLCGKVKKKGKYVIYYPDAEIIYEGTRAARYSYKYFKIFIKSLVRFWYKNGWFKCNY